MNLSNDKLESKDKHLVPRSAVKRKKIMVTVKYFTKMCEDHSGMVQRS